MLELHAHVLFGDLKESQEFSNDVCPLTLDAP